MPSCINLLGVLAEQLKKSIPAGQKINDDMLMKVMEMGSLVDTVPLVLNTKDSNFIGELIQLGFRIVKL
jgi:hypothetical protein